MFDPIGTDPIDIAIRTGLEPAPVYEHDITGKQIAIIVFLCAAGFIGVAIALFCVL